MKCIMCPTTDKNCRFYDTSPFRPICSKECYSKYWDKWTANDRSYYGERGEEFRIKNREAQQRWREKHHEQYVAYYMNYRKKKAIAVL